MDAETDAHIREHEHARDKREGGKEPTPMPGAVAEVDEYADPGTRKTQIRNVQANEALERSLDRAVPVQTFEVDGETHYRIVTKCNSCKSDLVLETVEGEIVPGEDGEPDVELLGPPSLMSRAFVAGVFRRAPRQFVCDDCATRAELEEERRSRAQEFNERLDRANLDRALRGFEFGDMKQDGGRAAAINAARHWATNEYPDDRGLLIFGGRGAGKTRLAATAMWQRLRRWPCRWVSWPILIAQLTAAFDDQARKEALKTLTGRGPLVLDDIAQEPDEKVSDWHKKQLHAALDSRLQAGAPLLVTSNLSPEGIGDVLNEKIVSRLVGYSRVLELPGQDMRLRFNYDGSEEKA